MRIGSVKEMEDVIAREDDRIKINMPMAWGLDELVPALDHEGRGPREQLMRYAAAHRRRSDVFYRPQAIRDYALSANRLVFPSAIQTETQENNVVP